ncbi:hypothetical protein M5689_006619 [Euphorbia peplus]|nr:hypothetical protein M5689_006619 [Euphorbia peplus]
MKVAHVVADEDENFMDDVLLGQGRGSEGRNIHDVYERMSHLYAEPFNTYIPPTSEDIPSSAPENKISSPIPSPVHTSPIPSPPH